MYFVDGNAAKLKQYESDAMKNLRDGDPLFTKKLNFTTRSSDNFVTECPLVDFTITTDELPQLSTMENADNSLEIADATEETADTTMEIADNFNLKTTNMETESNKGENALAADESDDESSPDGIKPEHLFVGNLMKYVGINTNVFILFILDYLLENIPD